MKNQRCCLHHIILTCPCNRGLAFLGQFWSELLHLVRAADFAAFLGDAYAPCSAMKRPVGVALRKVYLGGPGGSAV